ncbi:MAG TPA: amidase [Solirubrobacteraceae bacterium]|jgi:amidase|nr:amidase [Solirubrobacteraceae bacterium]
MLQSRTDADVMQRDACELAALVRAGELTASALVDASLRRIDALQPRVNAFVDVDHDGARAVAAAVGPGDARPFAGVPIAIKNNRAVKGLRLTCGAELTGDALATYDHNVTRRLRAAGFVVVGTTSLPEWAIQPVTEPRRFGPARNPWDLDRTPGGSSGGSAAAVAAGMVPLAHGNDGGGSLRTPAACCGLVGLKPQRGRISLAPDCGEDFLVQDGVLTRTVRDTALLLDVLAGPEPGDASWAPPPAQPFAQQAASDPGRLRIGVTTLMPLLEADLHPACERAAHDAAALLTSFGHDVREVRPPWRRPGLLDLFARAFGPAVCSSIAAAAIALGREPVAQDMEALSWALWQVSREIDAVQAELAGHELQRFARAVTTWSAPYDALLTPALAQPPLEIGALDADGPDPLATFERSGHFTPYTAICNVTGSPAISLPLYEHDGLPIGVQLIGRPAQEGPLLALAAQLEAAAPWAQRRPALAGEAC